MPASRAWGDSVTLHPKSSRLGRLRAVQRLRIIAWPSPGSIRRARSRAMPASRAWGDSVTLHPKGSRFRGFLDTKNKAPLLRGSGVVQVNVLDGRNNASSIPCLGTEDHDSISAPMLGLVQPFIRSSKRGRHILI